MARQIFGWRAVIGYIYPSRSVQTGNEYPPDGPDGVVFTGVSIPGPTSMTPEGLVGVQDHIEQATKTLATAKVDLILQAGIPISILNGVGTDKKIIAAMEKVSEGIPCTTQITAAVEAFKYLQTNKIVIVTGYFGEKVNKILSKFVEDSGFKVLTIQDLGVGMGEASDMSPYAYYRPTRALYKKFPDAQAIFIAGGNTLTNDVILPLEGDLGIPIVTQRAASLWHVFNMLGIKQTIPSLGTLFNQS